MTKAQPSPWDDAVRAAALLALDPAALGGAVIRAAAGPVRERWLAMLRLGLQQQNIRTPWRRLPAHAADDRLLGALDLAATLSAGRPILARGLLAEVDGGMLLLPMAERSSAAVVSRITAALDRGEVQCERDGIAARQASRFGVIALDEGACDDERPAAALLDRLALLIDLDTTTMSEAALSAELDIDELKAAQELLPAVQLGDEAMHALCAAALALGIDSLRAPLLAAKTARLSAALAGRTTVADDDIAFAARLVLAPRATVLPAPEAEEQPPDQPPPDQPPPEQSEQSDNAAAQEPEALDDVVLAAALAAIPKGLLARLQGAARTRAQSAGRAGNTQINRLRGRPMGSVRGEPRSGARLDLLETLRAAAPWQTLRKRLQQPAENKAKRVEVRRDDFRIRRYKQRTATTTVFAVDASGSSALHRLAEAKGAVELLLAECYVRRDRVALLAFRGAQAELLLPPTRSLVRAKRALAALPGGGATPLAAGIDLAAQLADGLRRAGDTPLIVLLTDGRANIARDGLANRPQAQADARQAARSVQAQQIASVWIDTAPQPGPLAQELAADMGANYLPMPYADAHQLAHAVRALA